MENNHPPVHEDDVFSSRDSTTVSQRASSSRHHISQHDPIQSRPRAPQKTHAGLTSPLRRGSPLNPQNVNQSPEIRRRPLSSDSPPRSRRQTSASITRMADSSTDGPDTDLEIGGFSNEYDLAHEDPRILQDVQRALKLKTRREARMKRESLMTPERTTHTFSISPASSRSDPPSNVPSFSPASSISSTPPRKSAHSTSSDVDFSPSTGVFDVPAKLHPVPASRDNGVTLDWTGTSTQDERRWTKSIVKKKEKDILPPLGVMIDQQEQMHKEKLARISNLASAQTTRKAHITSEQIGRRYQLIHESLGNKQSLNLAKVTRWYSSQPEVTRRSLERAEPFTWLKHLERRSGNSSRSPWHLTALIMEEYVQTQEQRQRMETIPEGSAISSRYQRKSRSPSFPSSPKPVQDDRISFEPRAESKRTSWDAISFRSTESAAGSIRTDSSNPPPVRALSPVSSRVNNSTKDSKLPPPQNVDQAKVPEAALSDESEEGTFIAPPLRVETSKLSIPEVSIHPPSSEVGQMDTPSKIPPGPIKATTSTGSSGSGSTKPLLSPTNPNRSLVSLLKPKRRTAPDATHPSRRSKRLLDQKEKQLRYEYEAKSLLLAEAVHHNSKLRGLLNRISTTMKDYDSLQNLIPDNVRGMLPEVPKGLIEAFGHDPAGVTGATRRLHGWRAVEDIHHRVHRQRQTFKSFLDSCEAQPPIDQCPLDKEIGILEGLLEALRAQNEEIVTDAESVSELLKTVQVLHGKVKEEYNKTVSHVAVVYPQLSHIVALEESYKDQYQQFWELGMDALTLLLDTVTPFWRQYGKTIGEDVRDFLIIPLYRNEFTGEAKRYRIKTLPRRSFRHWLGLIICFLSSIGVNILQVRAAISSTMHFRLSLIPYDGVRWTALPFFWISIIIQWFAVLFEFAIVFMELGVIIWWTGWTVNLVS